MCRGKRNVLAITVFVLLSLGITSSLVFGATVTHLVRGNVTNLEHYRTAIEAFNKIHPDITVELELVDSNNYVESVQVRIAGGAPPDVIWTAGSFFDQLALAGQLVDLDPFITRSGVDLDLYYPTALEAGVFAGVRYALPYQTHPGVHGLLYNNDLFAQAGLAPPDDDWTYDEFLASARAIARDTSGDGLNDIWGFSVILGGVESDTLIYSLGGRYVNEEGTESRLASPETVAAYQFFADLVHQYEAAPTPSQAEWWAPLMTNGYLGMAFIGPWHLSGFTPDNVSFDVGVANIPIGPGGRVAGGPSTDLYAILDTREDREAAFEWVRFLTSIEGLEIQTGFLSNPTPVNSINGFLLERFGKAYDPFIDGLMNGTYLGFSVHNFRGSEARGIVFNGVQPIWTGQESPVSALQTADQLMNALLSQGPPN